MAERSYARFYGLLKQLPGADKETLVWQYTGGRTASLREVTDTEYRAMCEGLERAAGVELRYAALRAELRRKRSACLHQMQKLGVDTADWARVDNFCQNPRVAGKRFARLSPEELGALLLRLRMIQKHGGLKEQRLIKEYTLPDGPGAC